MGLTREEARRSAAVTLSDMEMFIFPELIYSLVLANIMSPRIWAWREDSWFDGIERMKPYRRITRLKQYIMDHYAFNLDLDTWGLTTRDQELARFESFISPETLAQSNALFGYEGDKYYFDIDIRTHFGLDKYDGDVIPYWKTETVEAMDAFRLKPNYANGAGECVSLATLYAAALFIVARIPLQDIFLMATPLHSQNFVDVDDGILTNNRRLVTKKMWFNGTALSAQARRALENERVTIVAHESGVLHTMCEEASLPREQAERFAGRLNGFLCTELTDEVLGNFLRHTSDIQKCFQIRWPQHGQDHHVPMERIFAYEHGSPYRVTDNTRAKLMDEIEGEEFCECRLPSRIVFNDLEAFVKQERIDISRDEDVRRLKEQFASDCLNAEIAIESLVRFCRIRPQLPDLERKTFIKGQEPLGLEIDMTRDEIRERLESIRTANVLADMAFYAWRDLSRTEPEPFLVAAVQRCPVSVEATKDLSDPELKAVLDDMGDESIYDGPVRLAQPDEVWNFRSGDGIEKALLVANVLRARDPGTGLTLTVETGQVALKGAANEWRFSTQKGLDPAVWIIP
ncbi:MAG: hypothetical protein QGG69_07170 [Kiritimatiellia bacterium]|jgi:hypothetical protein|nr:hypothetical protein [Kiritimatiellia bacterium]